MSTKKIFWSVKENIAIIIGAAFVAFGVFFVSQNPGFFTASILSLQEKNFIIEKWRDIAYKTNSWYVDIFMSEKLETPESIDFTISFDKDTVSLDSLNLSGQGTRIASSPDNGSILIHSIPSKIIDKSQSLIMLPFTGNIEDILLSEAVATTANTNQDLSIWSLNEIISHSSK